MAIFITYYQSKVNMKNMFIPFPKALFYILLFILYSCNSSTETTEENKTHLEVYDVSCTEVWLHLKVDRISLPAGGVVRIEGVKEIPVTITSNDTLLFFDSLEVNREYKFKVILQNPGQTLTTNEATAKTLDTTSHSFTWQTFEFGEHSHSLLYDVAIIDENNIWAVGEIYVNDSLGNPDPKCYNAVHWNGTKWELKRISVQYKATQITPPLYSVFAFSATEIWFSSGVPIKGDGNNWVQYHLFDMGVLTQQDGHLTKIWGKSSNNIYFVGNLGSIAHWNGSSWTKIESGTSLNIYDIRAITTNDDEKKIFCLAANQNPPFEKELIEVKGIQSKVITVEGIYYSVKSLWMDREERVYLGGSGRYKGNIKGNKSYFNEILPEFTNYATSSITGESNNDIFIAGHFGGLAHYNGLNWKTYEGKETPYFHGKWLKVAVKGKTVVAVGNEGGLYGKIMIGRRTD